MLETSSPLINQHFNLHHFGISFETLLTIAITYRTAAIWCIAVSIAEYEAGVTFYACKIEMKKKMHEFLYCTSAMNVVVLFFHAPFTADLIYLLCNIGFGGKYQMVVIPIPPAMMVYPFFF